MIKSGVPPEKLSATAFGEYRPAYPNDTEKNRRKNRRVEIVIPIKDFDKVMAASEKELEGLINTQTGNGEAL